MKTTPQFTTYDTGSLKSYTIGFILSLITTLAAFYFVSENLFDHWTLTLIVSGLALFQAAVQLIFFFHLKSESSSEWNGLVFLFMLLMVLILVIGTLWIMYHLDYRMMPSNTQGS